MVASLVAAGLALRSGLQIRSARRARIRREAGLRPRHLRRARVAMAMLVTGAIGGPVSMWWLRGQVPFGTAHAWVGTLALTSFLATAWLGLRLRAHQHEVRERHALFALCSLLAGAAAFVTGFVLLP